MNKYDCHTLFNMSDERRRRFQFPGVIKHKVKVVRKRPKKNRDELLEFLRRNSLTSEAKLIGFRTSLDPTRYDYRREFGSWSKAKKEAFGKQVYCEITAEYLLQTVMRYGLYTRDQYHAKHKAMPEVVPAVYHVYLKWGTFTKLKRAVREYDIYGTINKYYLLWRDFGRRPTGAETQHARIYLDEAIAKLGADTVDNIVRGFLKQDEKRK